jgi:repressor of nif and glnA expression
MKVAIGTAICSAAVFVLLLAAVIAWEPKCGGFIYEFEFRSPVRHC